MSPDTQGRGGSLSDLSDKQGGAAINPLVITKGSLRGSKYKKPKRGAKAQQFSFRRLPMAFLAKHYQVTPVFATAIFIRSVVDVQFALNIAKLAPIARAL